MSQFIERHILKQGEPFITPEELKNEKEYRRTDEIASVVQKGIDEIVGVLLGHDNRKILMIGPCSIHEIEGAKEFAKKLKSFSEQVSDKFVVGMRTCLVKPRSTVGWKGYFNDPDIDDTFKMEKGYRNGRKLLLDILGTSRMYVGMEFVDTMTPLYIDDLMSYAWIGARSSESPIHREMASGVTAPVGLKNPTSGSITGAIRNVFSATQPQVFPGYNPHLQMCDIYTTGNPWAHVILRGWEDRGANYNSDEIRKLAEHIKRNKLQVFGAMIDCAHDNCKNADGKKTPSNQWNGIENGVDQINKAANENYPDVIKGFLMEVYHTEGNITPEKYKKNPVPGISLTDPCLSWEQFEKRIAPIYDKLIIRE
ncbi:MAG: 3-deoxy-7-phosphoheptulonate synthase [Candidatus Woesearchaeota archaeon]